MAYDLILTDPPWDYDDPGAIRRYPGTRRARADAHYPTVPLEELIAMRPLLDAWAAPDCALVVWGTWPKLREAFALIDGWGFEFVTGLLVWVKTRRDYAPGQIHLRTPDLDAMAYVGMGYYTRSGSEFAIYARRGKPPVPSDRSVSQIIHAPVTEHSRKPPEAHARLERLWPEARRLEMFARRRVPGWDAWGNEIEEVTDGE
jgi:N6-adenosine-specific RNA methylase IME4